VFSHVFKASSMWNLADFQAVSFTILD